jgi:hypothetical protein
MPIAVLIPSSENSLFNIVDCNNFLLTSVNIEKESKLFK